MVRTAFASAVLAEPDNGLSTATDARALGIRLREALLAQVRIGLPITYAKLALRDAVPPADARGVVRKALEGLMDDDAAEGRPLLAAVAVRTLEPGLPAHWFFEKAERLGLFAGDPCDMEAYAFHAREFYRVVRFHARPSHERRKAVSVVAAQAGEGGCDVDGAGHHDVTGRLGTA